MRILIADDHRLIVEGVKLKLSELGPDTQFVMAMDMAELREAIHAPDASSFALALIDLAMPGVHGNDHLTEVIERLPQVPVIVLSGSEDPGLMKGLLAMGVQGFIPKAYSPDVMLSAVRLVLSGGVYVPPLLLQERADGAATSTASTAPSAPLTQAPPAVAADSLEERLRKLLTERQIDVLRLLSQGKPNKLIARDLGISEGTVKIHLAAIFRALNVRNRVEAVVASRRISGL